MARLLLLFWPAVAAVTAMIVLGANVCVGGPQRPTPYVWARPYEALAGFGMLVAIGLCLRCTRTRARRASASDQTSLLLGANRRQLLTHVVRSWSLMIGLPILWIALTANLGALPAALCKIRLTDCVGLVVVIASLHFFPSAWASTGHATGSMTGMWCALPSFIVRAGVPEEFLFRFCIQGICSQAWGTWPSIAFNVCVFSACHVVSHGCAAKRAGELEHIPWRLVILQVLTVYVPVIFILCFVWSETASFAICVLLHGWIDAWYLGDPFMRVWQKRS